MVLANRQGRTVMEIWNFAPPVEEGEDGDVEGRSWLKEDDGVEEEENVEGLELGSRRDATEENVDMVDAYGEEGYMRRG